MLQSQKVSSILESSLANSDVNSYAVITTEGIVLDSRQSPRSTTKDFPFSPGSNGSYGVSSKLQIKVYATFASEFWNQTCASRVSAPQWAGAEAHERRFVIMPLEKLDNLLLLTVGDSTQSWGSITSYAHQTKLKFESNDVTVTEEAEDKH